MPPPFRARTAASLGRDVQIISRLRMAIKLDTSLPPAQSAAILAQLDGLIDLLLPLLEEPSSARRAGPAPRSRTGG